MTETTEQSRTDAGMLVFSPEDLDVFAPTIKRYFQIKRFRISRYYSENAPFTPEEIERIFTECEIICKNEHYPVFFVLDFEAFQTLKNWTYGERPIYAPEKIFPKWAASHKAYMENCGAWKGEDENLYPYCGGFENWSIDWYRSKNEDESEDGEE